MEQYKFSNNSIDLASETAENFLSSIGVERREALRIKLTLEEVLLEYQARFGEDASYKLKCSKKLSAARIEIIAEGERFNPLEKGGESDALISSLLAGIGLAPSWSYKNGANYIVFTPKKKKLSQTVKMLSAIVLSVAAGVLLTFLPETAQSGASELFLTPVTNLFMGLISAISGPLVFLSVLGSICSMGNMETLGKIGKKTISVILIYSAVMGLCLTAIAALFYNVTPGSGSGSDFSQILSLIYNIVPSNFFEPFVSGNALQIIFIAVIFGIAMLMLSSKVSGIFSLIEQLEYVVQTVMSIFSGMLPFAVFVIFANMIVSGNLKNLISSWKMLLIIMLLIIIYISFAVLWISLRKKVAPTALVKKCLPTFIIAFTTASSAAAFSTNVKDANKKLGIDKRLVDFGTPLGQVLFKPCVLMMLVPMQLSFAESYGMEITISWITMVYMTSLLLSFAAPPVAGGALMCLTIAFASSGIPMEVMGVAIAINAIIDFPGTATNTSIWQLALVDVADSLKMLDKNTLRSKSSVK